jgi:hypothetical protein
MGNHIPAYDIENPLEEEFQRLPPLSSACAIYKVPQQLRHVKEKAYTPKVVSIGPFHHGSEGLKAMEEHKLRYLRDFIGRTEKTPEYFLEVVRKNEAKLRDCYAETIEFNSEKFAKIILVDAAFILEVLLKSFDPKLREENDRIFNKPWLIQHVWTDMLLLENQLPFFILELLFNSYKTEVLDLTINKLTGEFFKKRLVSPGIDERWEEIFVGDVKIEHFVDLLRHVKYKPDDKVVRESMRLRTLTTPSVTELYEAGVHFWAGTGSNLFDIKFDGNKGILVIPRFILSDETELSFRNSQAFEQCHYRENYINDFVIIMNHLVKTRKDMELLVHHCIVENRPSNSREGSILLNKLADGAILDYSNFYFAGISSQLNAYYRSPWHMWKATWYKWKKNLKTNYFGTPWASISVFAAGLLLILTIIQTVCSLNSTRHPSN